MSQFRISRRHIEHPKKVKRKYFVSGKKANAPQSDRSCETHLHDLWPGGAIKMQAERSCLRWIGLALQCYKTAVQFILLPRLVKWDVLVEIIQRLTLSMSGHMAVKH